MFLYHPLPLTIAHKSEILTGLQSAAYHGCYVFFITIELINKESDTLIVLFDSSGNCNYHDFDLLIFFFVFAPSFK